MSDRSMTCPPGNLPGALPVSSDAINIRNGVQNCLPRVIAGAANLI